jgi:acetylornithine deacetylase
LTDGERVPERLRERAGIPAVICGPGSIDQAHKADEWVALSELRACEAFLAKVIAKAAA